MLEQFLREHAGGLASQLVERLGFDAGVAERFVPAAAQQLIGALQGGGLDLSSLLGGGDLSSVVAKVDVEGLAQQAGIEQDQARQGLEAIAPSLLSSLGDGAGGAKSLLDALGGGSGGGNLLGAAGKLAGGLFGKD